jgi:MFS transporter, YNFM family, putative membrane transport protein
MPEPVRPLLLLACGGFVSGSTIRIAEPLLPKVAHDFGVSVAAASVLITGFTLAYGLFQLIHGPLSDRVGRLPAVCGALLLAAVGSVACAGAQSLSTLALYRFLTGMTAGAVIPLSFAFVGDTVPYERRQVVLGRFIAGTLLGQTCGPLLGGVFSDFFGWRATFLVPAVAFVVIGVLLMPVARHYARSHPLRPPAANPLVAYAALLRSHEVRTILLAVGLEGCIFFGAFAYLGAFLRHDFDLSYTVIGVLLAGFGLGGVVYSLLVKVFLRRLGQRNMVAVGAWTMLSCFCILAFTPSWMVAAPPIALLGLGFYMLHNTLQTKATEMAPAARGSAISAFAFCLFLGQAIGVAITGIGVSHAGYRPIFAVAGLALALLAWWFRRHLAHSLEKK